MSQQVELVNQSLLRCHLGALISIAGTRVPAGLKQHPDVTKLGPNDLLTEVERYRSFLRGVKK